MARQAYGSPRPVDPKGVSHGSAAPAGVGAGPTAWRRSARRLLPLYAAIPLGPHLSRRHARESLSPVLRLPGPQSQSPRLGDGMPPILLLSVTLAERRRVPVQAVQLLDRQ